MRIRVPLRQVKRLTGRTRVRFGRSHGRRVLVLAGLVLAALACIPSSKPAPPAPPPSIEDARDLIDVLRGAGVAVQPTSALADPALGGRGQVLQIGEQLVQVYEYESVDEREVVSLGISSGRWPSGEGDPPQQAAVAVWAAGKLIVAYGGSDGGTHLLLQALLGDPITLAPEVVDEPYPAAVPAVLAQAAALLGVAPNAIEVIGLEEATWPDSCLGLPRPGESCTKGEVPGWSVEVRGDGVLARFRADLAGERVRLERTVNGP
jgi:hypothetical protein